MEANFQIFLILLAVLAGTALLARRINVAPAILLLLAGIALAFVPGMPSLELPPELVLLVVLPPLIYSASVAMSWREFKFNLRPIILLAVGCVIFTACRGRRRDALPDRAAVERRLPARRHRRAAGRGGAAGDRPQARTAAPDPGRARGRGTGQRRHRADPLSLRGGGDFDRRCFRCRRRPASFAAIIAGEMLFGAAVGWLSLRARHRARDPQIEITLSLITPYVAYWVPEHFGGSGVIATVACGLYMSWNGPLLISSATRLQGIFFWDLVIYLIEGLLFLLTGFQMRSLFEKSKAFPLARHPVRDRAGHRHDHRRALRLGVSRDLPAAAVVKARAHPRSVAAVAECVRARASPACAARSRWPRHWRCRSRCPTARAFPYRDLILFVTFGVIFITLVGFGLALPPVVRWLGVAEAGRAEHVAEHESEIAARREALDAALKSLDAITDDRELSDEVIKLLRARHETRANQLPDSLDPDAHDVSAAGTGLTRELIAAERKFIHVLLRDGKITDETRRRIERDLDLEEASLANREYRKTPL